MDTVDNDGLLGVLAVGGCQNNVFHVAICISPNVARHEWRFRVDVMVPRLIQEVDRLVVGHRRDIDVGVTDGGLHCYG